MTRLEEIVKPKWEKLCTEYLDITKRNVGLYRPFDPATINLYDPNEVSKLVQNVQDNLGKANIRTTDDIRELAKKMKVYYSESEEEIITMIKRHVRIMATSFTQLSNKEFMPFINQGYKIVFAELRGKMIRYYRMKVYN